MKKKIEPQNYPLEYARVILIALQRKGGIYQGTALYDAVAKRRAKGKVARQSRRINRGR